MVCVCVYVCVYVYRLHPQYIYLVRILCHSDTVLYHHYYQSVFPLFTVITSLFLFMVSVACPSSSFIGSLTNTHPPINPVRTNQSTQTHSGLSVHVLSMCNCDFSPYRCSCLCCCCCMLSPSLAFQLSFLSMLYFFISSPLPRQFSSWGFIFVVINHPHLVF